MQVKNYEIAGAGARPIAIDVTGPDNDIPLPLVIFVHGFKGYKDWGSHAHAAQYFARKGLRFLKFNFSHNGMKSKNSDIFDDLDSFAENTFSKELYDLHRVISFAGSEEAFRIPSAIFLIGHSLGGGISIIQALEDQRVSGLITWASVSNFRNLWRPELEALWRANKVIHFPNTRTNQDMPVNVTLLDDLDAYHERLDVLSAAEKLNKPFLIIHGSADPTVPVSQAQALHEANPASELLIIDGADHVFNSSHPWLNDTLPRELEEAIDHSIEFILQNKG